MNYSATSEDHNGKKQVKHTRVYTYWSIQS